MFDTQRESDRAHRGRNRHRISTHSRRAEAGRRLRRPRGGDPPALRHLEQASARLGEAGRKLDQLIAASGTALDQDWWRRVFYRYERDDLGPER
jgi:hypothetical protein